MFFLIQLMQCQEVCHLNCGFLKSVADFHVQYISAAELSERNIQKCDLIGGANKIYWGSVTLGIKMSPDKNGLFCEASVSVSVCCQEATCCV